MKRSATPLAAGLAVLAASLLAVPAAAQLALDPVTAGLNTTVTGSGSAPNGPVELFVDGISAGSVFADANGDFEFSGVAAVDGSVLFVNQSRVWNFNTDGDFEGWFVAGDPKPAQVSNGTVKINGPGDFGIGNITFVLDGPEAAPRVEDTALTRVFEMRYRALNAPTVGPGTGATILINPTGEPGDQEFGQNFQPVGDGNWHTTHIDLSTSDFGGSSTWLSTGQSFAFAVGINGFLTGDSQFEIDYIRLSEGYLYEFTYDGDFQGWGPQANIGPLAVQNGVFTVPADGNGIPGVLNRFSWFDSSYFNQWSMRMRVTTGEPDQDLMVDIIDQGGAEFYGATNRFFGDFTATGGFQVVSYDIGSAPGVTWGENPSSQAYFLQPFRQGTQPITVGDPPETVFVPAAGDSAEIDYIRLFPANAFGPSAEVTAEMAASVKDWQLAD